MKIFWESQCWPGSSVGPSVLTSLCWMPLNAPIKTTTAVQAGQGGSNSTGVQGGSMSSGIAGHSETRGLIAAGTDNGVVGISVTDTASPDTFAESDISRRYNYNLRGHHAKIQRVAWNSAMTKLGSCDENGVIYVWVPNEERWSVELVNDRGLKVRDFDWSPNGSSALILYEDNFVLIGSASGQRIWSNTFLNQVNCGAWSPNSKELVLGLETGQIQVFNDQGVVITERQLLQREECDDNDPRRWTLAAVSMNDQILFLNTQYEVDLRAWQSRDPIRTLHWSSNGRMLAVVCSTGRVVILSHEGRTIHSFVPPILLDEDPVVFTWAHKDEVVVLAAGNTLAVGRVAPGVPPLTELIAYQLWLGHGRTARFAHRFKLPARPTAIIKQFDRHVVRCRVPSYDRMCRFVCEPTFWRWFCTIMPIPRKAFQYMLCVEHLGGMIPVLIGRQINRVIPQFLISLPPSTAFTTPGYSCGPWAIKEHTVGPRWNFAADCNVNLPMPNFSFTHDLEPMPPSGIEDPSETAGFAQTIAKRKLQEDILLAHLIEPRNSMWRRSKRRIKKFMSRRLANPIIKSNRVLCHVSSNVWCTRFKITSPGIKDLPPTLAHVVYKTSVLHLQPRQMAIALCDLRPLTKTLPLPPPSAGQTTWPSSTQRVFRSADSSPATFRHSDRPRTSRGTRPAVQTTTNLLPTPDTPTPPNNEPDDSNNNNNPNLPRPPAAIRPVRSTPVLDPILRFEQQQRQLQPVPPQQRQFMTYAETRARLRDRHPIQRVPVAQAPQPEQQQQAPQQTRRRSRARALRNHLFRRTEQDQQSLLQHAHLDNINEQDRVEEERRHRNENAEELDTARHVRFHGPDPPQSLTPEPASPTGEEELVEEERRLYNNVINEFEGLREAVDSHISRMRQLADELENSKSKISKRKDEKERRKKMEKKKKKQAAAGDHHTDQAVQTDARAQRPHWHSKLDEIEFIDDDACGPSTKGVVGERSSDSAKHDTTPLLEFAPPPPPPTTSTRPSTSDSHQTTSSESTSKKEANKTKDETSVIDKLTALAADLRLTRGRKGGDSQRRLIEFEAESPDASPEPPSPVSRRLSRPSVDDMRVQFRDIARQLAQLEEAIRMNDMFSDLYQRVQNLKSTLGETPHAADLVAGSSAKQLLKSQKGAATKSTNLPSGFFLDDESLEVQSERGASPAQAAPAPLPYGVIRVANKTPFWNEESQVYQLDFGGRVTQESAKNFQIEHDNEQVMQFGRIENGAYTLDFCTPVSAVQAFGIALASITQRLK